MIVGRVSLLAGKAVAIKPDGSSRELSLGDSVESDELISVSAGGKVVLATLEGETVTVGANETWVASTPTPTNNSSASDTQSNIDPSSVETIQAALLAGIDPTQIGEATAAGPGGAGGAGGNEGSSFVRIGRGGELAVDAGLDFTTTAQDAALISTNFDDEIQQTSSLGGPGSPFFAFDDVDVNGNPGPRELIANNAFTNDSTPVFNGTGAVAGSTVRIYDNNIQIASVIAAPDGTWEIESPALTETPHSITITQQQPGLTESDPTPPLIFTVDITPPETLSTITGITDDVGSVQGLVSSGDSTDDATPLLEGILDASLEPDGVVNVLRNGVVIGQAIVSGETWAFEDATGMVEGESYAYTTQVIDPAGNGGVISPPYTIVFDTTASEVGASITAINDDFGSVQGVVGRGLSTDDQTPQLQGVLDGPLIAGDVVNVLRNGEVIGQAVVDGQEWSFEDTSGLEDGNSYEYTAQVVDQAGNLGVESAPYTIDYISGPQIPLITGVLDDVNEESDPREIIDTTDDARPTVEGTGDPGDIITLLEGGEPIGSTTVDSTGKWSVEPEVPLNTGPNTLTVTATDPAGNESPPSDPRTFDVQLPGPDAPAIDNVTDNVDPVQGNVTKGTGVTDDTTPTVTGSAQADAIVTLYNADNEPLGSAKADADGNWTITVGADPDIAIKELSSGDQSLTAKAVLDGVDSPETGAYTFKVDTSTPDAPAVIAIDDQGPTTGEIPVDGTTDDAQPTFSNPVGQLPEDKSPPGSVITLFDDGKEIGSTTVDKEGNWSITPEVPLEKGPHSITTTETGPNGKPSEPSPAIEFTVDASDVIVSITHLVDDVEGNTGNVVDNGLTNDSEPQVQGTATAGAVVSVLIGDAIIGSTTANSQGKWALSVPAANALTGDSTEYAFTATIQNPSDEAVSSNVLNVTFDGKAPEKITPVEGTDDVGAIQGPITPNGKTDDPTPTISGGGEPGDIITVYDNDKPLGSVTVDPEGKWEFTPSTPLPEGPHSITVIPTDPAGNPGDPSDPLEFDVDLTSASTLTFDEVFDNQGLNTGAVENGEVTDDVTPTLKGTGTAGELITIYNNGDAIASTTVDDQGKWEYELETALTDGDHSLTATSTNAAGAISPPTPPRTFSIDGKTPAAPSITTVKDDEGNVNGETVDVPKTSGITNDTQPEIVGTAQAHVMVRVYDNGTELGEVQADDKGNWSFIVPAGKELSDGTHNITADAYNAVGAVSPKTGVYDFEVDTQAADAPVMVATDDVGAKQDIISNNDTTDDAQPTFSGEKVEGGAIVEIRDAEGNSLGSVKADDEGNWSVTPVTPLKDGEHSIIAVQTDAAGNESPASTALNFTLDTTDVTVSIVNAKDNVEQKTDDLSHQDVTNDTSPELTGTAKANAIVSVYQDGDLLGSVQADSTGQWSYPVAGLTDGNTYQFKAEAKDAAGNAASSNTFELSIDTTMSAPIGPITVSDDVGDIQGPIENNGFSDDPTPTISGEKATPKDTIEVLDLSDPNAPQVIGSTTVDEHGNWSFTPSAGLPEGPYTFAARPVDPAGNIGPQTDPVTVTLDFTAPDQPVIDLVSDDVGEAPNVGDIIDGTTTDDARPTVSGKDAEPGSTITLFDGDEPIGSTTVDDAGNWEVEPEVPLNTGPHSLTVTATDPAGNVSPPSDPRTFDVQLPGPDAPAIDNVTDNVDPVQGNVAKGTGITDDTTPTVTGSAQADAIVTLYNADNEPLGSAKTDADGNWTITVGADPDIAIKELSPGEQSLTAKAVLDGVDSPETGAYTFKVDTSTPDAPAVIAIDDQGPTTGEIPADGTTDDAQPTFSNPVGQLPEDKSPPGSVITLFDDGKEIGSTTVDKEGNWSITPEVPLEKGPHSITTIETGPNGKPSEPSPAIEFTVDASDVLVSITHLVDDVEGNTGNVVDNGLTNDSEPQVQGTATAGAVVTVLIGGTEIGSTTANSQGKWALSVPAANALTGDSTEYAFTATIQNPSDEAVSSNVLNVTFDGKAPEKITPVEGTDDVGAVQGPIMPNGKTDDPTPTISGGGNPGDTITIYDNEKPLGSVTVDPEGKWEFTPSTPLPEGPHSITVIPTDGAGNVGEASDPLNFEVDISIEKVDIEISEVIDNEPSFEGDIKDGGLTNDVSPELKGSLSKELSAESFVEVLRNGEVVGKATVQGTDWSYTDQGLADETYTYTARVVDKAGNLGGESSSRSIEVDSTDPIKPIVDLSTHKDSTLKGLEALDDVLKHDNKTLYKQLDFDGQVDAEEVGSIIYYYGYATNGFTNDLGHLRDLGSERSLLEGQDENTIYNADNKFLLGSAVVQADGSWSMKMTETDENPMLSSVPSVDENGVETSLQYFLHVDAIMIDPAGNESLVADTLEIQMDSQNENPQTRDPLILDLNNDGIHTVSINDGITFDHDNDGDSENTGWVSAQDGLLVRDLDGDNKITSGKELFGDQTDIAPAGSVANDGYHALADLDSNNDGVINSDDEKFGELKVWVDADQDAITDDGELKTLSDLGITEIDLAHQDVSIDEFGNEIVKQGTFTQNGEQKTLSDVNLAAGPSSGGASFIQLENGKSLIGSSEVGNGAGVNSSLMLKVIVPPLTLSGEIFLITVNGPNGSIIFNHEAEDSDITNGQFILPIPNESLQANDSYVDGSYSLSLVVSTITGVSTSYPGVASFSLDTTSPDVLTNVEILNGADDVLDKSELAGNIEIEVGVPNTAKAGMFIHLDLNNDGSIDTKYELQVADIGATVTIEVAGSDFDTANQNASVTANLVDEAGNVSEDVSDSSDVQTLFNVSVSLDTLHIAWFQNPPSVGFDLSNDPKVVNGSYPATSYDDGGKPQKVFTDAPAGTEVTIEISFSGNKGAGVFNPFTVTVGDDGSYTFDNLSIPQSAWLHHAAVGGPLYCGAQISEVKIEAYVGTRADLESNIALDYGTGHTSPLILDLDGDGVETLGIDAGVTFDIDSDGFKEQTGWAAKDDGMLVRDLNQDGMITSGAELFGEHTVKQNGETAKDGFEALKDLDSNNDNVFNSDDDAYDELQVWQDLNSDGIASGNELKTLAEAGVTGIALDAQRIDESDQGNKVALRSSWTDASGKVHDVDDVWFQQEDIQYLSLTVDKMLLNAKDLGDANNALSELNIQVNLPELTLSGDFLIINVAGPNGTGTINHEVTDQDIVDGQVTLDIENDLISENQQYTDGEYAVSLTVSNVFGASVSYPSVIKFIVDSTAPDPVAAIDILNGPDDVLDKAELEEEVTLRVSIADSAQVGMSLAVDLNNDGLVDLNYDILAGDIGKSVDLKVSGASFIVANKEINVAISVIDPAGNSSDKVIGISDVFLNTGPSANDDSGSVNQYSSVNFNVLANDTDVDGDSLSIDTIVTGPSHGAVSINNDGTLTYTPNGSYVGSDNFVYRVADGNGGFDDANVSVSVNSINRAVGALYDANPAANQHARNYGSKPVGITARAVDPDGDQVTYSLYYNGGGRFAIDAYSGVIVTTGAGITLTGGYTSNSSYWGSYDSARYVGVVATSSDGTTAYKAFYYGVSPLILDLDGDGVETISIGADVRFDLNADGVKDKVGWASADDGFLVLDKNNDGVISDGSELFGEHYVKQDGTKAKDGFDALSDLDSNNDGVFDSADEAYKDAQIWQDLNSDGISQANELSSLFDAEVESISLDSTVINEDSEGNFSGLRSSWSDAQGNSHDLDDVWFSFEDGNMESIDIADLLEKRDAGAVDEAQNDNLLSFMGENTDKNVDGEVNSHNANSGESKILDSQYDNVVMDLIDSKKIITDE